MSFYTEENKARQKAMQGLPGLSIKMSEGEACRLAGLVLSNRRKIERSRDNKAKERGGYYEPPDGKLDMDLKRMGDLERLAYRLIENSVTIHKEISRYIFL